MKGGCAAVTSEPNDNVRTGTSGNVVLGAFSATATALALLDRAPLRHEGGVPVELELVLERPARDARVESLLRLARLAPGLALREGRPLVAEYVVLRLEVGDVDVDVVDACGDVAQGNAKRQRRALERQG